MRDVHKAILGILGVIIGASISCGKPSPHEPPDLYSGKVFVFHDGSDPARFYTFVIEDKSCLAQEVDFPGYENRVLYYCPAMPKECLMLRARLIGMPGEVDPPFGLGECPFARETIELDEPKAKRAAFFREGNVTMARWLFQLRSTVIRKKYQTSKLPPWVAGDGRITSALGFPPEKPTKP